MYVILLTPDAGAGVGVWPQKSPITKITPGITAHVHVLFAITYSDTSQHLDLQASFYNRSPIYFNQFLYLFKLHMSAWLDWVFVEGKIKILCHEVSFSFLQNEHHIFKAKTTGTKCTSCTDLREQEGVCGGWVRSMHQLLCVSKQP